jgi:hypothetical protein
MFAFAVSTRENAAAGRSCSARLACATRPLWSGPCISRRASYASPRLRRPRSMKFKTLHRLHTLTLLAPNPSESVCAHSSLARYTPGLSLRFMSTMYNLIWTYQKALPYSRKHGVPPSRPGCWVYPGPCSRSESVSTIGLNNWSQHYWSQQLVSTLRSPALTS